MFNFDRNQNKLLMLTATNHFQTNLLASTLRPDHVWPLQFVAHSLQGLVHP